MTPSTNAPVSFPAAYTVAPNVSGAPNTAEHTIINMATQGIHEDANDAFATAFNLSTTPTRGRPIAEARESGYLDSAEDVGTCAGGCLCSLLYLAVGAGASFGLFLGLTAGSMKLLCDYTSFCKNLNFPH